MASLHLLHTCSSLICGTIWKQHQHCSVSVGSCLHVFFTLCGLAVCRPVLVSCQEQSAAPQNVKRGETVANQISTLRRELRVYNIEGSYSFEECDQWFNKSSKLICHQNIHTWKKLYKCEECVKSFHLASTVNSHKTIHTWEKLSKCQECDKSFS
ncbi:zinc finger protein 682-like isoform X2 [Nannospalax galili]|uniref:zinc finger protein 682-like isoform X2 n=1 Tax=Nannospalax galili TaxID=1026970 RepID=UPI00111C5283|nr:zinc finger protein 682-like isoform X2 [Nannospalax galili]